MLELGHMSELDHFWGNSNIGGLILTAKKGNSAIFLQVG